MDSNDPIKKVREIRGWVEESLSSLDTVPLAEAKGRLREIKKIIDQLNRLQIPISEAIKSEKRNLEKLISTSEERKTLASLAKELSSLARDINSQLRKKLPPRGPKITKAPPMRLRVMFPDGTVVFEKKAVDTFVKSLQGIGLERVSEIKSVRRYGHPIVSRERNESVRNVRELDGFFVQTHSSTEEKGKYVRDFARALRMDIEVDLIDS